MPETREICGVEVELHRTADGVEVRIGSTWLTPDEVAALRVPSAGWWRTVEIDDFEFDEASVAELQAWVAGALAARGGAH